MSAEITKDVTRLNEKLEQDIEDQIERTEQLKVIL